VAPDLRTEGLHFAGARLWITDGKPVADLLYTRASGLPVALLPRAHRRRGPTEAASKSPSRGDLRVAYWQDQGYTFAVVGDLIETEVRGIAQRARRLSES